MKKYLSVVLPIVTITFLLATAVAASLHKASMSLNEAASVNGIELKPGIYEVLWSGTEPNIELTIKSKGKSVATVSALLVAVDHPLASDSVLLRQDEQKFMYISEIRFGGKKQGVRIK